MRADRKGGGPICFELEPYGLATYAPQVEALAEAPALALVAIRGEKGSVTPVSSPFKLEWQYA